MSDPHKMPGNYDVWLTTDPRDEEPDTELACPECGDNTDHFTEIDGCDEDCPRKCKGHGIDVHPCGGKCNSCAEYFCAEKGKDQFCNECIKGGCNE